VRVLVVDDAANLRDLLTVVLEAEDDFEVVGTAVDGEEALQAVQALTPDVVLLDLLMPVMDGLQALPEIRRHAPDAKIVIFSGFEQDAMAREALAAGADRYLEKGVSVTRLISSLRQLTGRPDPAC
jgi:DNA-binding NarL/FixJ family response regulator